MIKKYDNPIIHVSQKSIFDVSRAIINAKDKGSSVVIPHVCNNIGGFASGFAGAVRKEFPVVASNYEMLGNKLQLGYVQYVEAEKTKLYDHSIIVANMIAQNKTISRDNPRPLHYGALVKCMYDVGAFVRSRIKNDLPTQIHACKFGSQLAGGNFNFIMNLIEDIWGDLHVTYYEYQRNKVFQ